MEEDALMGTYYIIEGARHDRLPDNSLAGLAAWQEKEDAWLARLERIPAPTEIGSRNWVTYGLLKEQLENAASTRVCRDELWAASTTTSWHTWLPFVFDIQPLQVLNQPDRTHVSAGVDLDSECLSNVGFERLRQRNGCQ